MERQAVLRAWGNILSGYAPNLPIEITRECPLSCPGCYAYGDSHLCGGVLLRELADFKGQALIDNLLRVVRERRPIHLNRWRGAAGALPRTRRALAAPDRRTEDPHASRHERWPIPAAWADLPLLPIVVSIDGLQPEHDLRRRPATYDRILQHIAGQHVTVHCTLTRQQARPGYVLAALADYRLGGIVPLRMIFDGSLAVGRRVRQRRRYS